MDRKNDSSQRKSTSLLGRSGGGLGIYIHIPFCKQACHYCDFHFSTSLKKKDALVQALGKELELRKNKFQHHTVETIYFGGGTPSLLTIDELRFLIEEVYENFSVSENPEITLETNPDDLSAKQLHDLTTTPINRLSIGVQSFFDADLKLMNRAHNSEEAKQCLKFATNYFDNISIDLIYGFPNLSHKRWKENIRMALDYGIPHISSYALTVEPKTPWETFIKKGIIDAVDDDIVQEQFYILVDTLESEGFVHYEISNFGKEGFFSRNNSAYWQGKPYLGIGPSAHSFNGNVRSWNVRNNSKYIQSINEGNLPSERELLSNSDKFNENIMTGLRTIYGVSLEKIESDFGIEFRKHLLHQSEIHLKNDLLYIENGILRTTKKGKFLADGIASDLFKLN